MKKYFSLSCFVFFFCILQAQNEDYLKVQKYTLDNGLVVYLNQDLSAKNVFGSVVIKAGSKNDPADATGIAHYLEHLLFNGTNELGTTNYEKEKIHLDSIKYYYELLGKTKDEKERKKIQQLINKQSVLASKYIIPKEFDKLLGEIGCTQVNAFTTFDETVYLNAFPVEYIEKWLDIYSQRFTNPVFRNFQTELETVYEEKNRASDNIGTKIFEEVLKNTFKNHPYGTQTTIGTSEHLRNPSLEKMYQFFNTYYVPNNMALILTGNFETEKVLPMIKEKFAHLKKKDVPTFPKYTPSTFDKVEIKTVRYTPIRVSIMSIKTVPLLHPDRAELEVLNSLLFNESGTGKLNKLEQDGKIMNVASMPFQFNDDGTLLFFIVPKIIGQSIKKAEQLVLNEIEKIKQGEFSDEDLEIIKMELYKRREQDIENISSRNRSIASVFSSNSTWEDYLNYAKEIEAITKEDIIRVANIYFQDKYFVLRSRTGFPKKDFLEKPDYKPTSANSKAESIYAKHFKAIPSLTLKPKFLDFKNDAQYDTINQSNALYVVHNKINDIFTLNIQYKVGSNTLKNLDIVAGAFNYFHTKNISLDSLKRMFALLGLTYYADCDENRLTLMFSGLEKNFQKSLELINKLLQNPILDEKYAKVLYGQLKANVKFEVKDPNTIGEALYEYAKWGKKSTYIDRISLKEFKQVQMKNLQELFVQAISYNTTWHYVGKKNLSQVKKIIQESMSLHNNNKQKPLQIKKLKTTNLNKIYFIKGKKILQSQVFFYIPSDTFYKSPKANAILYAFGQYMGGTFTGLIWEEIREFRSLAYKTYGIVVTPRFAKNYPLYFSSFVGCQSDKTLEAINVMNGLLTDMPVKKERMKRIKLYLENSVSSSFPDFRDISMFIEDYKQRGFTSNPLVPTFQEYKNLTFEDLNTFYKTFIKDRKKIITVYGKKKHINFDQLSKYGTINELKIKDIFTY